MMKNAGLSRLRKTLTIHRIVQVFLVVLLLLMAMHFWEMFQFKYGNLKPFYNSLVAALLLQVALFLPIRKFAGKEARRELVAAHKGPLSVEEQTQLRRQRLFADFMKASVFIFFVTFIVSAPPAGFVLSTAYFCCIGTILSYLQHFNFAVSRQISL